MHLTIQDYFRHGAVTHSRSRAANGQNAEKIRDPSPFSKALAAAQAVSAEQRHGLTIQDYMNKRVPTQYDISRQVSQASRPASCDEGEHSTQSSVSSLQKKYAESLQLPADSKSGTAELETTSGGDSRRISNSIQKAAARFELPKALIQAVIKAESNYQVRAVSPAGARGLMQLMPATAKDMGVTDPFDIDQNIHGGARYLRNMLDQFNGDLELALSAYNAGPGAVMRYNGSVPPYPETQTYVKRVLNLVQEFSATDFT